jgi:hypothetical protein
MKPPARVCQWHYFTIAASPSWLGKLPARHPVHCGHAVYADTREIVEYVYKAD